MSDTQTLIPIGDPMRDAWEEYRLTDAYANTRTWALKEPSVDGSLWAAFIRGWGAREDCELGALRKPPAPQTAGSLVCLLAIIGALALFVEVIYWAVVVAKSLLGVPA